MLTLYAHLNWLDGASEVAAGQGLGQPVLGPLHFFEGFTESGAGDSVTVSPALSFSIDSSLQVIRSDSFPPALAFSITPDAAITLDGGGDEVTVAPALSFSITPDAAITLGNIESRTISPALSFSITPSAFEVAADEDTSPTGGWNRKPRRFPTTITLGERHGPSEAEIEAQAQQEAAQEREREQARKRKATEDAERRDALTASELERLIGALEARNAEVETAAQAEKSARDALEQAQAEAAAARRRTLALLLLTV